MGQAASAASSGTSLASLGFSIAGTMMGAEGQKAGDDYRAATLERAAQYGELKATQTNATMTRNLAMTLGNIDAVRAAAHGDPASPSDAAVRSEVETIATGDKTTRVASIMAQSREDEANAAYLRSAGNRALLSGELSSMASILQGSAGAMGGGGGGSGDGVLPGGSPLGQGGIGMM